MDEMTPGQLFEALLEEVRKEAAGSIGLDPGDIGDDDLLFEMDGGQWGDSLDRAELVMGIEEMFDFDVPGADTRQHFKTVRTIADYLVSRGKGVRDVRGL